MRNDIGFDGYAPSAPPPTAQYQPAPTNANGYPVDPGRAQVVIVPMDGRYYFWNSLSATQKKLIFGFIGFVMLMMVVMTITFFVHWNRAANEMHDRMEEHKNFGNSLRDDDKVKDFDKKFDKAWEKMNKDMEKHFDSRKR